MKAQLTEPKQLDYQKKIEQSGKLLLAIINNVLDMARIESGKIKVDENYEIYKKYYGTVELRDNMHKSPKTWLNNFFIEVEDIVRNF